MDIIRQHWLSKVIFLDVDGVLNDGFKHPGSLNVEFVENLRKIEIKTRASIVLCSSWRESKEMTKFLLDELWKFELLVRGFTGVFGHRCEEIWSFIHYHPSITNFVVLDDWDMRHSFGKHQILTCSPGKSGLTRDLVPKAVKILEEMPFTKPPKKYTTM